MVEQIGREGNVMFVRELNDDALPGAPGDSDDTDVGMMLENMKNMIVPLGGTIEVLKGIEPDEVKAVLAIAYRIWKKHSENELDYLS